MPAQDDLNRLNCKCLVQVADKARANLINNSSDLLFENSN